MVDCRFAREGTNIACLRITCKQGSTSQGPTTDTAANGMRQVYDSMNNLLLMLLLVVEDLNENINDLISKYLLNNVFFSIEKTRYLSESLILREVSSVVVAKSEGRPFPELERRLGGKSCYMLALRCKIASQNIESRG